ncbi:TetR/AcrR family transcriptional regulator [uncultured Tateyamaria sp.]|uniref:TetR/AcrR family transcriptional regulator n=1 Tax=uncultured Tateyamaria sp. TaxID=455651 RepID=UPI0026167F8B|nr:TetR/AcrR family transcriptional regulator [uncultured Tateyamaria sp.]
MKANRAMRKRPAQKRSEDTVHVILEASTQVLDTPREASVTTNHIAERAGVSIGSLYRYFADKQGILTAVVRREAERQENRTSYVIDNWSGHDGDDLIRQVAAVGVHSFHGRRWVRGSLHKHLQEKDRFARDLHALRYRISLRLENKLVEHQPNAYRILDDAQRHAMLGGWSGIINAAVKYSPHDFDADALKSQLVNLVNGYVRKSN